MPRQARDEQETAADKAKTTKTIELKKAKGALALAKAELKDEEDKFSSPSLNNFAIDGEV